MKTVRLILSLMVVVLLASCSAEGDVLNEMDEHNQLPSDENVTVTLNLSAKNATRAGEDNNNTALTEAESKIDNCVVLVFGSSDVLLAKLDKDDFINGSKSLTIKKQPLKVYAIANFSDADETGFTASSADSYMPGKIDYTKLNTEATALPKSGSATAEAGTKVVTVNLKQLTARIDQPEFGEGASNYTYEGASVNIGDATFISFPLYVYPSSSITMSLVGQYKDNDKSYSFGPFTVGGNNGVVANNIYKLIVNASDPQMPAGLWIDWYVAEMLEYDIQAEVGGN